MIETESGDITLSQDINTTSTSLDAIIVNAGRASAVGDATGGDIKVSGSPTLTVGSGGQAKLFSGSELLSTGLTALVGGTANTRAAFDETSDLSGEGLVANQSYAIYRVVNAAALEFQALPIPSTGWLSLLALLTLLWVFGWQAHARRSR